MAERMNSMNSNPKLLDSIAKQAAASLDALVE